MESKIIEMSMATGFDWTVQLVLVIGLGILIFKGVQVLNIYIKKNKE